MRLTLAVGCLFPEFVKPLPAVGYAIPPLEDGSKERCMFLSQRHSHKASGMDEPKIFPRGVPS